MADQDDVRDAAAREAASREGKDESLPELELKQIARSERPVIESQQPEQEIEDVLPWHNYTIVNPKSEKLLLFDENAKSVDSFADKAHKSVSVDWKNLFPNSHDRLTSWNSAGHDDHFVDKLPIMLQRLAKSILRRRSQNDVYTSHLGTIRDESFSHCGFTPDGKYLVLASPQGGFFAFQTETEAGLVLPPRDWIRLEPSKSEETPQPVVEQADGLVESFENCKQLNAQYSAVVTDVGISIVQGREFKSRPVFSAHVPSIEKNVTVDPSNPDLVYFCQSGKPGELFRLDISGDPSGWKAEPADFPKSYDSVSNLQFDPSGRFLLFYTRDSLVVITRDTLQEVKQVKGMSHVNFDEQGNIRAIDQQGHLVIMEPDFKAVNQALEQHRIRKLAEGIDVIDLFDLQAAEKRTTSEGTESLDYLQPLQAKYEQQFQEALSQVSTVEGIQQVRQAYATLRDILKQQGLKAAEVDFIADGLDVPIKDKEKSLMAATAQQALVTVRGKLDAGVSIASIAEARAELEPLRSGESLLDDDLRRQVRELGQELEQKSLEYFRVRGGEIIRDVQGLLSRTRADLEGFTTKSQMDDWMEFRYPQLKSRLGALARDCPLEADEAYKAISAARTELQAIASEFEEKFKREYAKVREKAAARMETAVDTLKIDLTGLIERLRAKAFTDRAAAEQYLEGSEARRTLQAEIQALAIGNPDAAKELDRALKVTVSNALTEIERGSKMHIAETGQQLVQFGHTYFPKWEAKVREHPDRNVDLSFQEDPKSHGPGVKAGEVLGDASLTVRTGKGQAQKVRLYENLDQEEEWRLGLQTWRGKEVPASYMRAADYKVLRQKFADWSLGERSTLRRQLAEKKAALREIYSRRAKPGQRSAETDQTWQEEYRAAFEDYAAFCGDNMIALLERVDDVKDEPDLETSNGKGFVPDWKSHWVLDPQAERELEEMADALKMQLELQEGILNLKGHAGSGKDVRIKMFCHLTNRPYFGTDCTKWTTEYDLSEDVALESKDGASQTVWVPSTVLNGITTPGAVVYFNEFNAMSEQAQIFLHALMDEKRSLTLKTKSGQVIRAHPSVLLVSSMNPDYPGTFNPQFATRSRMLSIEIDYPPSTRQAAEGDSNHNPAFDASEPLRIARELDSLTDLTYEANMERNGFVKLWDRYVNGIDNGAPEPTRDQKFDIDVILALTQFANRLRADFIKVFEKSRDARNALPVSQPITGRELRRCAYALNALSAEEKVKADAEATARSLLEKYYLTSIDRREDQDKIRTAMATWTSQKRVRA